MTVSTAVRYALVAFAVALFAGVVSATAAVTGTIAATACTVVFFDGDPRKAVSFVKELLTTAEAAVDSVVEAVENQVP
jgi:hypothetical protein